ncbi:hypothetical protein SDC9_93593 [bioreactor metagenome]|uniref:DUF6487 domain-containing protein n=1 Tax=bioreactor metagenome TaxID=1076179 RepID=A0A645A1U7_9ZZZZ|nr:PF20097 family protein [Oscillibacter sp.]
MGFWNQDDEGEWEKYQKSKEKESQEPEEKKTPSASDEFRAYFKTVRQAQSPESGEAEQPGEKASPLQTFFSRFRGEKPEEPEGPPEKCPWCGGDMVKGYLSGEQGIYWSKKKPGFLDGGIFSSSVRIHVYEEDESGLLKGYVTTWHCQKCHKMVLDTLLLDPPLGAGNSTPSALSFDKQIAVAAAEDGENHPENNNEET